MATRTNQHYVPQFYFRHFATNGARIGLLLVRHGQVVPQTSIKGQCSRRNFYSAQELEAMFAKLESQQCIVIRAALEVANDDSAPFFTVEEHTSLCDAVILQRARTAVVIDKHGPGTLRAPY